MPVRQILTEALDELRSIRKAIEGLRRDLKRRHDAEQAERKAGELVVFPHERRTIKNQR